MIALKPIKRPRFGHRIPSKTVILSATQRWVRMLLGIVIGAFGYAVFQVPHNISAGGIGSISIIINHYTGHDVGLVFWLINIPMITLGFFLLGRWPFVAKTLIGSSIFSALVSFFLAYLPSTGMVWPMTDNLLLSTIYGGVVGGISGGLIYGAGGSLGGSGVLSLVMQKRTGIPISSAYLINDSLIIAALGFVFGWENAMYGMMMLVLNGFATDYAMEGPSTVRTATIVTNRPKPVANALMTTLDKGVSYWEIKGGYTDETRYMLMTTVNRNQVESVQDAVATVDTDAFVTIGISHHARGQGFTPLRRRS